MTACLQVPDQYGTIRAVSEGKGEEFLVGTSRNFILRGTFNDGFLVEVQVRPNVRYVTAGVTHLCVFLCFMSHLSFPNYFNGGCAQVSVLLEQKLNFRVSEYLSCDVFKVRVTLCCDVFRVTQTSCGV